MQDRRIRGSDGMEDIPRDENEIRLQLDYGVNHSLERLPDVGFALIDAVGSLPLVLAETEMDVCEVNKSHRARIALIH
jgi:hypothetical protein